MKTTLLTYDEFRYDFRGMMERFLGCARLSKIRTGLEDLPSGDNSLYKNMEQSPIFKLMYDGLNGPHGGNFYQLYEAFIREVIRPQYEGAIYYQTKPSHRILFADVSGQSRYHRDADYGHDPAEVNYWVPLTPAFDTNTIWIESEAGKSDHQPVKAEPGQYIRFSGATLSHGAKKNTTGDSRVSFDFRVIPADKAPERYRNQPHENGGNENNPVMANALKFSYCA